MEERKGRVQEKEEAGEHVEEDGKIEVGRRNEEKKSGTLCKRSKRRRRRKKDKE